MLVSLIIPIYNVKPYLKRCLDSVVCQDYPNIEVILVNDGSTDNPEEIINSYVNKYKNFIYINQTNKGVGAARNAGVLKANGNYISYLDSDDLISPDYCSYLLNIIGDADIAVAGREKYINEIYTRSKTAPYIMMVDTIEAIKYMLLGRYNAHPAWGKLYKRELVEKISFIEGYIFEEIRYSLDSMIEATKVVFADKDLYSYRVRPCSIMTSDESRQIKDFTLSAEYVYRTLVNKNIYSCCEAEFKIFLAKGIIRNTKLFNKNDIDMQIFKEYTNRMVDMLEELGGLGIVFQ